MKIIILLTKDEIQTRTLIAKNGMSLRGFAKKIDVSHSYLSQVLSGKRHPSPEFAKRICDGLNTELEDIFLFKVVD